jgi:hypothetical protein
MLVALALFGCAGTDNASGQETPSSCAVEHAEIGELALSEFVLDDRNETSPTFGSDLTPRCYLDQISVWFMLDAT